jgi:hypothetical protein
MQQLLKVLCDTENLANSTSKEWAAIISSAQDNREDYCKVLKGKTLFSALYGTYTVALHGLEKVIKDSTTHQVDSFKEVQRRKRHCIFKALKSKSKLYYDRQSVGQSVLVSGTHLGTATYFSHSLFDYFLRQLQVCWCGAPYLTRSQVCTFQFLPGIASAAFLRSESYGTHKHSLLSQFLRLAQPGRPGSCFYFRQEQGSPVIPPWHLVFKAVLSRSSLYSPKRTAQRTPLLTVPPLLHGRLA